MSNPLPIKTYQELSRMTIAQLTTALMNAGISTRGLRLKAAYIQAYLDNQGTTSSSAIPRSPVPFVPSIPSTISSPVNRSRASGSNIVIPPPRLPSSGGFPLPTVVPTVVPQPIIRPSSPGATIRPARVSPPRGVSFAENLTQVRPISPRPGRPVSPPRVPYAPLMELVRPVSPPSVIVSPGRLTVLEQPPSGCVQDDQGRRRSMEDRHVIASFNVGDSPAMLYGVFDGHGGVRMADLLSKELPAFIDSSLRPNMTVQQVSDALRKSFIDFDARYFSNDFESGSTAIVALILNNTLYFANLGDARGLLFDSNGNILLESKDHKPNDPEEEARIRAAGGYVTSVTLSQWNPRLMQMVPRVIARVDGNLAVSRAFGDYYYKKDYVNGRYLGEKSPVSPVPDIYTFSLVPGTQYYLILACDGLWDVMSSEDVIDRILNRQYERARQFTTGTVCNKLIRESIDSLESSDNMTVIYDQIRV